MPDIKVYKQLLTVELKDGTLLNTEKSLEQLQAFLSEGNDFLLIDGCLFGKYEFKKAYERKIDSIEAFILGQPKDLQAKIRHREKQMYERVGKKFETIEQVQKFLDTIK